jgi:hypothetical protein
VRLPKSGMICPVHLMENTAITPGSRQNHTPPRCPLRSLRVT